MAFWRSAQNLSFGKEAFFGKHKCSVCGNRLEHFDPLPPEHLLHNYKYSSSEAETCNEANYTCRRCGATDRERLYALYLKDYFRELLKASDGQIVRFVDFAPSPPLSGFIKNLIGDSPNKISYRTADLFKEGVDDQVDIMDLKIYGDNSIDFFICSHILEHVTDDRKALAELYRILRAGGRGILVVPIVLTLQEIDEDPTVTDPEERWRRFGQDDHVRLYSKGGFLARVKDAGFKVYELDQEHFGKDTFRKHGITESSVLYVVEKE